MLFSPLRFCILTKRFLNIPVYLENIIIVIYFCIRMEVSIMVSLNSKIGTMPSKHFRPLMEKQYSVL